LPRPDRSRPAAARSDAEREQARLERERRRAEAQPSRDHGEGEHASAAEEPAAEEPAVEEPRAAQARLAAPDAEQIAEPTHFEQPVQPRSPAVAGVPRAAPSRAGRGITRARVGAVLALLLAAAAVWFLLSLFQPFAGSGSGAVIVEIPKGASSARIGSILARDGVVSSGFFFELRAFLEGKRGHLHSGRFQLKRNMSYAAAIQALSAPPPAIIPVKVVIPEGFSRVQIARRAQADTLSGDYLAASKRSPLLDPRRYGAPSGRSSLEGFLFPATYELSAGESVTRLVEEQLAAFMLRFGPRTEARARTLRVSPYQLLTIASMVEREARVARDRPLIAAVIYNRLRTGMALGVDATTYYALALRDGPAAYERELSAADLRLESPYNTRLHTGLPPTPISNPGVESIEAAAHPARVPYLYYVAAPDGCGEHVFSSSYAQFLTAAAAYQAALRRNGGRPPACAKK
jgi:uncharacterized YceG family protein